jgi:hypothetical protein
MKRKNIRAFTVINVRKMLWELDINVWFAKILISVKNVKICSRKNTDMPCLKLIVQIYVLFQLIVASFQISNN